jgi:electron-transferring-flavoprotein dehydrogenase
MVSIGLVTGLDYKDPALDPHREFQRYKLHPKIRRYIDGGKMLYYGAKSLPEGGLYSMPKLYGDGFLICGDAGGFLNGMRLKGIHLAIRSGMLAAETILEGLKRGGDFGAEVTRSYDEKFRGDWSHAELRSSRNFHQGFHGGRLAGLLGAGFNILFGGRGLWWKDDLKTRAGHTYMKSLADYHGGAKPAAPKLAEDGVVTFDKLTDVYASGTEHEEDQPCHLVVPDLDLCHDRCTREYGNPCQHFCPTAVYEMEPDADGQLRLKINASNCVHCKTCDIMDPYQNINWVTPEGGGGPSYQLL